MPRTFGSNFNIEKNKVKNAAPFLSAIIRFGASLGGDLGLVGRGIDAIGGRSPTIGALEHHAVVKDWGTLGSGFGSQSDGTPDLIEVTIRCDNFPTISGYRLSDRFVAEMETIPIDIFWNFIVGTTVYQEDGPSGSVHAPTNYGLREVSLRVTSLMDTYLMRDVLHTIHVSHFPNAPQESEGKVISLAIGDTATNPNFDGARIPAVVVDEHQPSAPITGGMNTFALIACEAPTSGLTVTSIGARYWQGHKVIEQDFTIDDDPGTSTTVPLNVSGSGVQSGLIPDIYDVGTLGAMTNIVRLGDASQQISHIVQPFIPTREIKVVDASIGASGEDPFRFGPWGVDTPLRPLTLGIMNAEDSLNDGGILPTGGISSLGGDINQWRARATASFIPPADTDGTGVGNDSSVFFNMHGWEPELGKQHYAVLYMEGSSNSIPVNPNVQWHNIGLNPGSPGSVPIYNGITLNQPAYTVDWNGNWTQLTSYLPLQVFGRLGPGQVAIADNSDELGATGIFNMALEPEAAVVIGGITLYTKQKLPQGAVGPVELSGSLTVTINEVDSNGIASGSSSLGSASFSAADFASFLNTGSYSPIFQTFSTPILLEAGKRYNLRIEGEVDATGKFNSWTVQSLTAPVFSTSGFGFVRAHLRAGSSFFNVNSGGTQILSDVSEPVSVRLTLHAVKFETAVETWDGVQSWVLRPYIRAADKRFVVPSGTDISSDAVCSLSQPDEVIHALLNRADVPDARIDLAGTFTDSAALYSAATWLLRGAVTEQITYKALIARLAFESRSDFDWEFHQAQLKWIPQPGDTVTSVRTLTFADMPQLSAQDPLPDFNVVRTETSSIINIVNVVFQRMFNIGKGQGAYLLGDQFISNPSVAVHGPKTNDALFQMDFIRDIPLAQALGEFYLRWLAYALPKPIFTTKLHTLELMKGDVIVLDLSSLVAGSSPGDVLGGGGILGDESFLGDVSGSFNGWTAQPVLLRAIQHDWPAQRIQYTAVIV